MEPWLLTVALVGGGATLLAYLVLRRFDARCPRCGSRDIEEVEVVHGVGSRAACHACKHTWVLGEPRQ